MMKKIFPCMLLLLATAGADAQFTEVWNYRYGGNQDDFTGGIIAASDGGALSWGYSYSGQTGDKSEPLKGLQDYWVVKVDANGIMQTNKSFGGSDAYNYMTCVTETFDHGFLLGGYTPADSGIDKSENNKGHNDFWIIRIDSNGNKLWDKTFGTTKDDFMTCICTTSDSGFLLGGSTSSGISADKQSPAQGMSDYWIIKIDSAGAYQWDRDFGGNKEDDLFRVVETHSGGFYLAGLSYSNISGDKTENSKGSSDFWIIKTDVNGNYLWDKDYGTPSPEGELIGYGAMDITADDGAILATNTESGIGGDKTVGNWSVFDDFWAIRLDSSGNKMWDNHYGGVSFEDDFNDVWHTSDGGFLLSGTSYSGISGNKSESNAGAEQAWFIKVDSTGNKVWDKTLLTNDHIEGGTCALLNDGCFLFNTYSLASAGFEKSQDSWSNSYDYFFAKFCLDQLAPQAFFEASATMGCEQLCVNFTDLSANNPSAWQWSFPGGSPTGSADQSPINICYSTPGTYDVTLISSNGSGSDTITLPNYITILAPVPVLIVQYGNVLSCEPPANTYQWSLNGNVIPGATSQQLIISQAGSYAVDVIDSSGCTSQATINVISVPSADFMSSDTTVCEKFCTDFTDLSTNNPIAWHWIFQGGDPSFSFDQDPASICYQTAGVYDVTLITTDSAGLDTFMIAGYITVNATPAFPTITQTGLTLTSSNADSYQWQFNAVNIPGATNQSYVVMQTGLYTVIASDSTACSNSITVYVSITGINDLNDDLSFRIYPNPSSGIFTLDGYNNGSDGKIIFRIYNSVGQLILSGQVETMGRNWTKQFRLENAADGYYFMELKTADAFAIQKIMIRHG